MKKLITLDLSCPVKSQHSNLPECLRDAMIKNKDLLKMLPYKYTRNQHRITYKLEQTKVELEEWLDFFLEYYPEVEKEVHAVKKEMARCEIEGYDKNNFGRYQITLANLKRHCDKTNEYYRWFYPDM